MRLFVLLVVAIFTLAGCGSGGNSTASSTANPSMTAVYQQLVSQKLAVKASVVTSTEAQKRSVLTLFQSMFNATPGSELLSICSDYLASGMTEAALANILANTTLFQSASLYPKSLSNSDFSIKYVNNLVGTSVNETNKSGLAAALVSLLDSGMSRGELMSLLVNVLSNIPTSNTDWGKASAQLNNRITVSYYYSVTKAFTSFTDFANLQAITASVTDDPTTVTAAQNRYAVVTSTVSGKILTVSGTPIPGVRVTLGSSNAMSITTDASGSYSFTGISNGTYTLSTVLAAYSFSPGSISFSVNNNGNLSMQNIVGTLMPTVISINPSTATTGAAITITGSNFSTNPASNAVKFNGVLASVTAATATSLSVTVPSGATTGIISVATTGGVATSAGNFTVSPGGASVSLYKYLGSVQCFTGIGTSVPAMQQQLSNAGIQVLNASCGVDGNISVAMCGASDGSIGIFEVYATQAQAASALGFIPLSNLPAASKIACNNTPRDSDVHATPIQRKYLMLTYNPILENRGGQRLIDYLKYNDPAVLAATYSADIKSASYGIAQYTSAGSIQVDEYPVKEDGFQYDDASFLSCIEDPKHSSCHKPSMTDGFGYAINYQTMLQKFDICNRFNAGEFDELWLFGAPFMGFYEAVQAGSTAIWTNGPVITGTSCSGRLNIMGFSYERGVAEMLEDFGHRAEGTLSKNSLFSEFTRYESKNSGQAQCGNVHWAPNSIADYDWSNHRVVTSACEDWLNYPNRKGTTKTIDCNAWGCNARQHKIWWLSHFPSVNGVAADGLSNNWWSYLLSR